MMSKKIVAITAISGVAVALAAAYCFFRNHKKSKALIQSNAARKDLNIDEATTRYNQVQNLSYELTLSLLKGSLYEGYVKIHFDYKGGKDETLFVDYAGKYLKWLKINGVLTKPNDIFLNQRISFSGKELQPANNEIEVYFVNEYSKSGLGLHHFVDPVDKEEYTYTQFESFFAHDCFPCFDQPDLKASMAFEAIAPKDYNVISNEKVISTVNFPEAANVAGLPEEMKAYKSDMKFVKFQATGKISSYLYAFISGPYDFFEDNEEGFPPMRIYMRKTLKQYAAEFKDEFFHAIKQGIRFYEDFFQVKFPWNKYDQIYCPEYKFGAMENVGAVTYNEGRYLFRKTPTIGERTRLVCTIVHELAHMWFGDLVTMKWWTGTWLNESFATFMSILCMLNFDKKYTYIDPWIHFQLYKEVAFDDDQFPSNHSVESDAKTTEEAESNFDGITYGKGASSLKQLWRIIGEDAFKKGIRSYFAKYQYSNTTLHNFLNEMKAACEDNKECIDEYKMHWLISSGMNILSPVVEYKDNKISSFKIEQRKTFYGVNIERKHKLDIALYYKKNEALECVKFKDIVVQAKPITEIEELKDAEKPYIIQLNYDDWTFGKIVYDKESIEAFKNDLHLLPEPLSRSIAYKSLYDMAKFAIKPHEYLDIVLNNLPKEVNADIISRQLLYSNKIISMFISKELQKNYKPKFMSMVMQFISKSSYDIEVPCLNSLLSFISEKKDYDLLVNWLTNGINGNPKKIDPVRNAYIIAVYGSSFIDKSIKDTILANELKNDKSDEGIKLKYSCEAADKSNKRKTWNWYVSKNKKESDDILIASMSNFYQPNQDNSEFEDLFLTYLPEVMKDTKNRRFNTAFFTCLCPKTPKKSVADRLKTLCDTCKEQTTNKLLRNLIEENSVIAKAFEE